MDVRDTIDWVKVGVMLADEEDVWYNSLVGDTAYEKLVDFRSLYLKSVRILWRSKRWWDSELPKQVTVVCRARR